MKKVKFLVTVLALVFAFQLSEASTTSSNTTTVIRETILKSNQAKKTNRPNAPSRSYIECFYGEGFVQVVFPDGIQTMTVRVFNGVDEYAGTVTADTTWVELPILSGIYDVECTTDDGRVFSGSVEW